MMLDWHGLDMRARCMAIVRHGGDRAPVLVVHGLQCDISFALRLARVLPRDQPILAFRAQGVNGHEPPLDTIEAMAARYLAEARAVTCGRPSVLVGFCAGAAIAKEMAHQATKEDGRVERLFVVDMARTTTTDAFRQLAREQVAIARKRTEARAGGADSLAGGERAVAAYVRALVDYAAQPGQPKPYDGPTTIVATRRSMPMMAHPDHGWQGTFPDESIIVQVGEDRADLMGPALVGLGRHIHAATAPPVPDIAEPEPRALGGVGG